MKFFVQRITFESVVDRNCLGCELQRTLKSTSTNSIPMELISTSALQTNTLKKKSLFLILFLSLSHSRFQLNRDCWMERAFSFDFPKVHGAKKGRRKLSLKESRRTKCCFGCKCIFHFWQKYQYKVFTNIEKHFQIELKYRYIYIDDFV